MNQVLITDVTLREYGQNVTAKFLPAFSPEIRAQIGRGLLAAGFQQMEVFSCVNPKLAPAMDDRAIRPTAALLGRADRANLITLVPNRAGLERFLKLGLGPAGYGHSVGIFFSAVEAHNLANLGRTIKATLREYELLLKETAANGLQVAAYISAAFGYRESPRAEILRPGMDAIRGYLDWLFDSGATAVTLSDLQGVADEAGTARFLEGVLKSRKSEERAKLGYHPHHLQPEKAIANSKVAYDLGLRRFDASLGGTGGCITGAPGNQPTEQLVSFLHTREIETGINAHKLFQLSRMVREKLPSR